MSFIETLFSLKNKVVIITGAGGSIAGTLATAIAQAGASVIIIDIVCIQEQFYAKYIWN